MITLHITLTVKRRTTGVDFRRAAAVIFFIMFVELGFYLGYEAVLIFNRILDIQVNLLRLINDLLINPLNIFQSFYFTLQILIHSCI